MADEAPELFIVARSAVDAQNFARSSAISTARGCDPLSTYVHATRLDAMRQAAKLNAGALERSTTVENYQAREVFVWSVLFDAELAGL
jgi:hypothetical protein